MTLQVIRADFSVCRVADYSSVNLQAAYCFIGKTDEENSLVCQTADVPGNTLERDDGWKAFRIEGTLDFSLIGILAMDLRRGARVSVTADGADERRAVEDICALLSQRASAEE